MSAMKFTILITIIVNICGGVLLHRCLKEQESVIDSHERRILHIYEVLGIE